MILNGKQIAHGKPASGLADFTSNPSGDGFFTSTTDASAHGAAPLNNLRLHPIGGPDSAGDAFEVDWVRIHTTAKPVPEPG